MREAVGRRGERAERFVLDVDQLDGLVGRDLVPRNDGRHGIADEPDLVAAERVFVMTDRQDAVRNRKRLTSQHQVDAFDLRGICRVHADDAGMRLRGAQQPAVQHAREDDVVGEARLPGHLGASVNPSSRLPDHTSASGHRGRSVSIVEGINGGGGGAVQQVRQRLADPFTSGMWLLLEKRLRSDENSGSAVAALSGAEIGEALLQRMEAAISGKALDRRDVPRVALRRQQKTREHRMAVEEYGARTALAKLAPVLGAGQLKVFAQHLE